jgi:hypothetical protein
MGEDEPADSFLSYSHRDDEWKTRLENCHQLTVEIYWLQRTGCLSDVAAAW